MPQHGIREMQEESYLEFRGDDTWIHECVGEKWNAFAFYPKISSIYFCCKEYIEWQLPLAMFMFFFKYERSK